MPKISVPFQTLCQVHGVPAPEAEYRFAPPRRWRFDWAWPDALIAVEQEGGVWVQGRHTRGSGFVKDIEKYNHAAAAGWRVLRATPKQIDSGEVFPLLRKALGL